MLSEVLEEKVDKDQDEHCLNKAGAGLLLVPSWPPGGEDKVLWRGGQVRPGADHGPDQVGHELQQLL